MKSKTKRKKQYRFFWFLIKLQIVLMLLVIGGVGYYYYGGYATQVEELYDKAKVIVEAADEQTFVPSRTSFVFDVNGELISERSANKDAEYITYDQIPAKYITTIISIEDKKFYSHKGVDIRAVFRAIKALVENGKVTQGGSTITMQLAKLVFMDSGKTWQYKVEQMFLATELEKRYSKSQILEYYFNNIYFANGYYGIGAACRGYFDCGLEDLNISQIAFLLAIPNSPTYYDPITNMKNTIDRRNLILRNLLEDGKISESAYMEAVSQKIVLNMPKQRDEKWNNYVDTYAYHCATKALMEKKGFVFQYYFSSEQEEKTYNEEYAEQYAACQKEIYAGGYEIYTSIDMD